MQCDDLIYVNILKLFPFELTTSCSLPASLWIFASGLLPLALLWPCLSLSNTTVSMNREKVPNKFQSLTILTCGWFLKYRWQENFQHVLRIHWGNVLEPSSHLPALLYLTSFSVLLRRQGRLRGRVSYYNREWKSDLPSRSPSLSMECSFQTIYGSTSLWLLASFLLYQAVWSHTVDCSPWHECAGECQVHLPSEKNCGPWIL